MTHFKHGKFMFLGTILIDFLVGNVVFYQIFTAAALQSNCEDKNSCADCIQSPGCGWCSQFKTNALTDSKTKNCIALGKIEEICIKSEIPKATFIYTKDAEFREDREGSTVQLKPQEVRLTVRVGEPIKVDFAFKKARDYPVDLYYLLDFSSSMQSLKDKLSSLAIELANKMGNETSQLQLGFGSFVDKVVLPFTNTHPNVLANPCPNCVTPFSFRNNMPLTNETSRFRKTLDSSKLSTNEDFPEGGFDGLLQTMVCEKEINWRQKALKIIVFCTDANFHISGDGKLGGVVEPHDGLCHLNSAGEYTHSLIYDYPSISQIDEKAKAKSMNIIFALVGQQDRYVKTFEMLAKSIEGASMGYLHKNEDIVSLVLEHYKSMSLSMEFTHNATSSISVKFEAKCPGSTGEWEHTRRCSNVSPGDEISLRATIHVADCSQPNQIIEIKPVAIPESALIYLTVKCQCDCEDPTHPDFVRNSANCSNSGNLTCGRCQCPESFYGAKCECAKKDFTRPSTAEDLESCQRDNVICSGRGRCICGTCECDRPDDPKKYHNGTYCECDNYSCPNDCSDGKGECHCGKCDCHEGWQLNDCSCSTDTRSCISPTDFSICSNHGECVCDRCECHDTGIKDTKFTGKFCDRCMGCKVNCTSHMHNCVDCLAYSAGPYAESVCNNKCSKLFQNFSKVEDVSGLENYADTSTLCTPLEADDSGCSFQYVPYYRGEDLHMFVNEKKTCPEPVNVVAIAAGVAGSIILAGIIALLIWKCVTTIHDKREFEKFETQRKNTQWGRDDNPLYRKALTTHTNPAFEGLREDNDDTINENNV